MKKPVYIRCPRCELNYIEKKEKLCSVCKAELSAKKDEYTSDLDLELCPICKTNYISPDEIMCATCLKEQVVGGHPHFDLYSLSVLKNIAHIFYL